MSGVLLRFLVLLPVLTMYDVSAQFGMIIASVNILGAKIEQFLASVNTFSRFRVLRKKNMHK